MNRRKLCVVCSWVEVLLYYKVGKANVTVQYASHFVYLRLLRGGNGLDLCTYGLYDNQFSANQCKQ